MVTGQNRHVWKICQEVQFDLHILWGNVWAVYWWNFTHAVGTVYCEFCALDISSSLWWKHSRTSIGHEQECMGQPSGLCGQPMGYKTQVLDNQLLGGVWIRMWQSASVSCINAHFVFVSSNIDFSKHCYYTVWYACIFNFLWAKGVIETLTIQTLLPKWSFKHY